MLEIEQAIEENDLLNLKHDDKILDIINNVFNKIKTWQYVYIYI